MRNMALLYGLQGGNVTCMSMGCPPLKCKNPVKPPGYCCGVCPLDCVVRGRNYSEGQTFADPRDKCNVCTCAVCILG